jgi:Flp pilus assembly protein TadG
MKKSTRANQRGNSLVEFALAAVLLVTLFAAVFQFGYTFMEYNKLEAAVRSGARYGSRQVYASTNSSVPNSYRDPIRNMVVYGQPTAGSTPQIRGLATSNVSVEMVFASGVPSKVRIGISGFQVDSIFTTYTFSGKPIAEFPFIGTYAPQS